MTQMDIRNTTNDIEMRIAAHFEDTGSQMIVSVYLFGSRAEGRAHRESDVDVGVLMDREALPTRRDRFDASLRMGVELGSALSCERVDLVVLNDAPPLFARRIVIEGRRVFCRDPEIDHGFVRDVQLRAADLQPFLDRMQTIKLKALAPR